MAFPIPPDNLTPIPNNPFYYPEGAYLYGPSGPLIVGSGFSINNATGTINVSGGGSGAPTILAGAGISVTSGVGTVTIANTGIRTVTAGAGIAVSVAAGNLNIFNTLPAPSSFGTVTSISTGPGLIGGPITTSGTIGLTMTGVSPGTYNNATITVDSYGRITFASPGSSFGGGITATGPIAVTNTFPQNVSIQAASTSASGAVQLNDTVTSTSTTQAATANAVKVTYDVASQAQTDATNAANSAATAFAQASSAQALASTANANAASAFRRHSTRRMMLPMLWLLLLVLKLMPPRRWPQQTLPTLPRITHLRQPITGSLAPPSAVLASCSWVQALPHSPHSTLESMVGFFPPTLPVPLAWSGCLRLWARLQIFLQVWA